MARKKLVVLLPASLDEGPASLKKAHNFAQVVVTQSQRRAIQELQDAEGFLLWDVFNPVIRNNPLPPRLEWIHTASVGVDAVLSSDVAASQIVVTNTRGVFEYPIAEYVLGLLLMVARDFRNTTKFQRAKVWKWRATIALRGQTVVLIGPGAIGREVFTLLRAVGVKVLAVGRRQVTNDPVFGRRHSMEELEYLLPAADAVILALPLTSETAGVMNKRRFSQMKHGSSFINIGRGGLVDEDALLDALKDGQVGTAALDVFAVEPLPTDHPFWSMDQVFVSPHMSADLCGWEDCVVAKFIENLERWALGKPLENIVDKAARFS
ncbi:D-2-hydroxyacid dehydrogenase [Rhizobium azibense]|uniref:Phosphoglycerate dehydrogenase-like enzyme n=1 Tax=Rhizobium azibense TaxID=1136135 RepID=A0A4R3RD12_9HYPH|nr:D-2-hydroxyacid dehydrogenase [Rhizobium azibense]TCU32781.1 phosphoglycerate dehydrogenase-like enzyme [Rhizobium azibense]